MQNAHRVGPRYLALFASLYALQGVVVAYFFNFNQLYMIAGGVERDAAAYAQSLALVPFILKFLGGPLSDRVNVLGWGHRRPYIVIGVAVQSLGLWGLSLVHPGAQLGAFTAVAVLTVAGMALYDTCCDGLVLDVTPPGDRERVQGMLVASRFAAAMLCTLGFGFLLDVTGNGPGRGDPVLWICAALGVYPLIQALLVPEPRRADDAESFQWRALRVLIRPRSLVLLAFGAFYALVGYGVEISLSPFYGQALHFRERTIGVLGASRYVGRVIGAALLPVLASRLGRSRVLKAGLLSLAIFSALQGAIAGPAQAGIFAALFGAANGWTDALFYVLAMEASDPRMAASTYALFMAVTNISVTGGSLFAWLVTVVGQDAPLDQAYRMAFLVTGVFVLLAWPSVGPLSRPLKAGEVEP
jgi:PAT family beta-lactamase induction signal transducer AmpG